MVFICSQGIKFEDISKETIEVLKKSDVIINLSLEEKDLFKLNLNKKILNLNEFLNYKKIYEENEKNEYIFKIIISYLKKCDVISLLIKGNPLFLNKPIFNLFYRLREKKIEVKTITSTSSFDHIINIISAKTNKYLENFILLSEPSTFFNLKESAILKENLILFNSHTIPKFLDDFKQVIKLIKKRSNFYLIKYQENKTTFLKYKAKEFERVIKQLDKETTIFIPSNSNSKLYNISYEDNP
ncbi:MAG: hypothetical protein K6357_05180 [Elusimicrobiota bacterium]